MTRRGGRHREAPRTTSYFCFGLIAEICGSAVEDGSVRFGKRSKRALRLVSAMRPISDIAAYPIESNGVKALWRPLFSRGWRRL